MNHSAFARPKKALGQHFLHDANIIDRIIECFKPLSDDTVIEIGPGRGALTERLLNKVSQLHLVEFDRDLAHYWRQRIGTSQMLTVHEIDALKADYSAIADGHPLRVIGNLPYNISTPILFRLLDHRDIISDMLLMLQKEVVDRMTALPGNKVYGRLSVMIQQACRVESALMVRSGAFIPPPRVNSAMVRVVPYPRPPHPATSAAHFARVVKGAFGQRRKTLRNALRNLVDERQFEQAQIDPGLRPEQLSIEEFVRLSNQP